MRWVAEEAEIAYEDLAAVVDVLRRINISRRVGSLHSRHPS